jgi:hypothetical protein
VTVNIDRTLIVPVIKAAAAGAFIAIALTDFIPHVYAYVLMLLTDFSLAALLAVFNLSLALLLCVAGALVKTVCGAVAGLPALAGAVYLLRRYPDVPDNDPRRVMMAALGLGAGNAVLAVLLGGMGGPAGMMHMGGYFIGGAGLAAYLYLRERRERGHYN